jgi:hypothetical protein
MEMKICDIPMPILGVPMQVCMTPHRRRGFRPLIVYVIGIPNSEYPGWSA